jgi:HSP20 family protein
MSALTLRNNNSGLDLFDKVFGGSFFDDLWTQPLVPAKRDRHEPIVKELDDRFEIALAAPGLEKSDFKVAIDGNQITVGYDVGDAIHRYAYASKYSMSYTLPSHCDAENIGATYKNGVLIVGVPKTETSKAREIKIK